MARLGLDLLLQQKNNFHGEGTKTKALKFLGNDGLKPFIIKTGIESYHTLLEDLETTTILKPQPNKLLGQPFGQNLYQYQQVAIAGYMGEALGFKFKKLNPKNKGNYIKTFDQILGIINNMPEDAFKLLAARLKLATDLNFEIDSFMQGDNLMHTPNNKLGLIDLYESQSAVSSRANEPNKIARMIRGIDYKTRDFRTLEQKAIISNIQETIQKHYDDPKNIIEPKGKNILYEYGVKLGDPPSSLIKHLDRMTKLYNSELYR